MAKKDNMKLKYELEEHEAKYVRELQEYWNAYMYAVINEIYVGVGINLGLSEKEAYKLAKNPPGDLKKAGFFKNVFDKFKSIFKYKVPKFRYKKKLYDDGPLTPKQWEKFNEYMDKYWKEVADKITGDVTIKSHMLGKQTTKFREKKKPYKNKSLYQVIFDQYEGDMPDSLAEAYRKYDFHDSEKKVLNKSFSDIAMYVTKTGNDVQEAIRQNVQIGTDNNKSPVEIASDLYWEVEKNENFVNKYTAQSMRKNWNRIAATELVTVYEAGILAPYEAQAMESLKEPEKAVYFVRTGGTCEWCRPRQGSLVRLVPNDIVVNTKNESLKAMGINDPNTDIAIWAGKNNVGLKQNDWLICCPAHPYNQATFEPIDIKDEYYDEKYDEVRTKEKESKYVSRREDLSPKMNQEEKERRKPVYVGNDIVSLNDSLYEAVEPDEYDKKLEESRKNPQLPIPVNKKSPSYNRIFGNAKEKK